MASLVLSAATASGTIALGPVGLFAWSTVAAAVDGLLIYPTFFGADPVEGQRLNGLDFQRTEQGSPANRLFGGLNRVAGTLVWASPLREKEDRNGSSKGGSGGAYIRYKYYCDIVIEIARMHRGQTISGVSKVFADGKEFFNENGLKNFTSTHISSELDPFFGFAGGITEISSMRVVSDEAAGGPNLTEFQTGRPISISGFSSTSGSLTGIIFVDDTGTPPENNAGSKKVFIKCSPVETVIVEKIISKGDIINISGNNYTVKETAKFHASSTTPETLLVEINTALLTSPTDGTVIVHTNNATNNNGNFDVYKKGRLSVSKSFITVRTNPINTTYQFTEHAAGDSITLLQENTSFSKAQAGDVRFYNGSRSQSVDSVMLAQEESRIGVGNVPALRGRALMVIENLELTDFGNRIPSFEFIVRTSEDISLKTGLQEMILDSGLGLSEFDLSKIPSDMSLEGFVIRGPQSIKTSLQPIMLAYSLVSQQVDGKITLFRRQDTELVNVTNKTVAFGPGETAPRPARFTQVGDQQLVNTNIVTYYDKDDDLQPGKKQAKAAVKISDQVASFDTNLTLTGDQAQRLVDTLYEIGRTAGRQTIKFTLPPSYLGVVKESMRITITKFNQTKEFLINRVEEGSNFIINCEALEEDLEAFNQEAISEGSQAI